MPMPSSSKNTQHPQKPKISATAGSPSQQGPPQLGLSQGGVQTAALEATGPSSAFAMDPGSSLPEEGQSTQKDEDLEPSLDLYVETLMADAREEGVCVPPSPWHTPTDSSMDIMYYGLSPAHPAFAAPPTTTAVPSLTSATIMPSVPFTTAPAVSSATVPSLSTAQVPALSIATVPSLSTTTVPSLSTTTAPSAFSSAVFCQPAPVPSAASSMVPLTSSAVGAPYFDMIIGFTCEFCTAASQQVCIACGWQFRNSSGESVSGEEYERLLAKYKTLRSNMLSLVGTAQKEMQLKQQIINQLRGRIRGSGSEFSPEETEPSLPDPRQAQTGAAHISFPESLILSADSSKLLHLQVAETGPSSVSADKTQAICATYNDSGKKHVLRGSSLLSTVSTQTTTTKNPAQNDLSRLVNKRVQTNCPRPVDRQVQTDTLRPVSKVVQTDWLIGITVNKSMQTHSLTDMMVDQQIQTDTVRCEDKRVETDAVTNTFTDKLIQTDSVTPVVDWTVDEPAHTDPVIDLTEDEAVGVESVRHVMLNTQVPRKSPKQGAVEMQEHADLLEGDLQTTGCVMKSPKELSAAMHVSVPLHTTAAAGDSILLTCSDSPGTEPESPCQLGQGKPGQKSFQSESSESFESELGKPLQTTSVQLPQTGSATGILSDEDLPSAPVSGGFTGSRELFENNLTKLLTEELSGAGHLSHMNDTETGDVPPHRYEMEQSSDVSDAEQDMLVQSDTDKVSPSQMSQSVRGKKRQLDQSSPEEFDQESKRSCYRLSTSSGETEFTTSNKSTVELKSSGRMIPDEEWAAETSRRSSTEKCDTIHSGADTGLPQGSQDAQTAPSSSHVALGHRTWGRFKNVRGDAWKRKLLLWPSYAHRIVSRKKEIDAVFFGQDIPKVYDWSDTIYCSVEQELEPPEHHQVSQSYSFAHLKWDRAVFGRTGGKSIRNQRDSPQSDGVAEFDSVEIEKDNETTEASPSEYGKPEDVAEFDSVEIEKDDITSNVCPPECGRPEDVAEFDSVELEGDNVALKVGTLDLDVAELDFVEVEGDDVTSNTCPSECQKAPREMSDLQSVASSSSATVCVMKHKKKKKPKRRDRNSVEDPNKDKKVKKKKKDKKEKDHSMVKGHRKSMDLQKTSDSNATHSDVNLSQLGSTEISHEQSDTGDHDLITVDEMCKKAEKEKYCEVSVKASLLSSGQILEDNRNNKLQVQSEAISGVFKTVHSFHTCPVVQGQKKPLGPSQKDVEPFSKGSENAKQELGEIVTNMTANKNQEDEVTSSSVINTGQQGEEIVAISVLNMDQDSENINANRPVNTNHEEDIIGSSVVDTSQKDEEISNSVENTHGEGQALLNKVYQDDSDFSIHTDDSDSEDFPLKVLSPRNKSGMECSEAQVTVGVMTCDVDSTKEGNREIGAGTRSAMSAEELLPVEGDHVSTTSSGSASIEGSRCQKTSTFTCPESGDGSVRVPKMLEEKHPLTAYSEAVVDRAKGDQPEVHPQTVFGMEHRATDSETNMLECVQPGNFDISSAEDNFSQVRMGEKSTLTNRDMLDRNQTEVIPQFPSSCQLSNPVQQQKGNSHSLKSVPSHRLSPQLHCNVTGNADVPEDRMHMKPALLAQENTSDGGLAERETTPEGNGHTGLSETPTTPVGIHQLPVTPKKTWLHRTRMANGGEAGATKDLTNSSVIWSPDKTSFNVISNREPISHNTFDAMLGFLSNSSTSSEESAVPSAPHVELFPDSVPSHWQSSRAEKSQHINPKGRKATEGVKHPTGSQLSPLEVQDKSVPEDKLFQVAQSIHKISDRQNVGEKSDKNREEDGEKGGNQVKDVVLQVTQTTVTSEDRTPLFGYPSDVRRGNTTQSFPYKRRALHLPPSSSSSASSVTASRSSSATSTSSSSGKEGLQLVSAVSSEEKKIVLSHSKGDHVQLIGTGWSQEKHSHCHSDDGRKENVEQIHCDQEKKIQNTLDDKCESAERISGDSFREDSDRFCESKKEESGDHLQENTHTFPFYIVDGAHCVSDCQDQVAHHTKSAQNSDDGHQNVEHWAHSFTSSGTKLGLGNEASPAGSLQMTSSSALGTSTPVIRHHREDLEEGELDSMDSYIKSPNTAHCNVTGKLSSTTLDVTEPSLEEGEIRSDDDLCSDDKYPSCSDVVAGTQADNDFAENASFRDLREVQTHKRRRSPEILPSMTSRSKRTKGRPDKALRCTDIRHQDHKRSRCAVQKGKSESQRHEESICKEGPPPRAEHSGDQKMQQADRQVLLQRKRSRVRLEKLRREIVDHRELEGENTELRRFTIPKLNRSSNSEELQRGHRLTSEDINTPSRHFTSGGKGRERPKDSTYHSKYSTVPENQYGRNSKKEECTHTENTRHSPILCLSEKQVDNDVSLSDIDIDSDESSDSFSVCQMEGSQRTRGFLYYRDPLKPRPELEISYEDEDEELEEQGVKSEESEESEKEAGGEQSEDHVHESDNSGSEDKSEEEDSEEEDEDDMLNEADDRDKDSDDDESNQDDSGEDDGRGHGNDSEGDLGQHQDDGDQKGHCNNDEGSNRVHHNSDNEHRFENVRVKQKDIDNELGKYKTLNIFVDKHACRAGEADRPKAPGRDAVSFTGRQKVHRYEESSGSKLTTECIVNIMEKSSDCLSLHALDEGESSLLGDLNLTHMEEAEKAMHGHREKDHRLERGIGAEGHTPKPQTDKSREGTLHHQQGTSDRLQFAAEGQQGATAMCTGSSECESRCSKRDQKCAVCAGLCCGRPKKKRCCRHVDKETGGCVEPAESGRCRRDDRTAHDHAVSSSCLGFRSSSDQNLKNERKSKSSTASKSRSRERSRESRDRSHCANSPRDSKSHTKGRHRSSRDQSTSRSPSKENWRPSSRPQHSYGRDRWDRSPHRSSASHCFTSRSNRERRGNATSRMERRGNPSRTSSWWYRYKHRPSAPRKRSPRCRDRPGRRNRRDRSRSRSASEDREYSARSR